MNLNQKTPTDVGRLLTSYIHAKSPQHAACWVSLFIERHPAWQQPVLTLDEYQQMRDINRYWRTQLGLFESDTLEARTCIIDNVPPSEWIATYDRYIIPTIVRNPVPNMRWA